MRSGGTLDIHYQGDPASGQGNYGSNITMTTVNVYGSLNAGSLTIKAPTATVHSGGVVSVVGGGYLSDSGPGEWHGWASWLNGRLDGEIYDD